ncbi:GNAT family N-acetyltransferase [Streptomyces sp. NPDC053427]|uniref:GNAT family N-acetyltransferase n=1 Tax=Streptomyces sp. NPDC053427 TaxID=3365701 RepID=UPI0037D31F0F
MTEMWVLGPDNWSVWRALRLAALAEAPNAFGSTLAEWQGDGDREERWRARLGIRDSHNVVAVLDGRPVGMVSGVPTQESGTAELISMWVSPPVRGQGVADRLIGEVERWAIQRCATRLRLSVMPDNPAAIAFYARHGFAGTAMVGDLAPDGGRREMVLAKPLPTA